MKKSNIALFIIYLVVMIYFAAFNWEMFSVTLNINTGFSIISFPVLIAIFAVGFVFLIVQWGIQSITNLKAERDQARKEAEIKNLKASYFDTQVKEADQVSVRIEELHQKLDALMDKLMLVDPGDTSLQKNEMPI